MRCSYYIIADLDFSKFHFCFNTQNKVFVRAIFAKDIMKRDKLPQVRSMNHLLTEN